MNLFTMGPIVPDVLGLSVAADWLDRRDDDRNNYFGKHNRKSVDMTLGLAASENNLFDLNVVTGEQEKTVPRNAVRRGHGCSIVTPPP